MAAHVSQGQKAEDLTANARPDSLDRLVQTPSPVQVILRVPIKLARSTKVKDIAAATQTRLDFFVRLPSHLVRYVGLEIVRVT